MRMKPVGVPEGAWNKFETMADEEGYGIDTADWDAWWECFYAGYRVGLEFVDKILENERRKS